MQSPKIDYPCNVFDSGKNNEIEYVFITYKKHLQAAILQVLFFLKGIDYEH